MVNFFGLASRTGKEKGLPSAQTQPSGAGTSIHVLAYKVSGSVLSVVAVSAIDSSTAEETGDDERSLLDSWAHDVTTLKTATLSAMRDLGKRRKRR
jgi:hypothetical protein